jgi:hypothetical protein
MLRDPQKAVSIPFVVSRAAEGDYAPLKQQDPRGLDADLNLMGSSIWCNEPWTGLDASGPCGTDFDSNPTGPDRGVPAGVQLHPEARRAALALEAPHGQPVPVPAFAGGADPQDSVTNLSDLKGHFPDSRTVLFPHLGHDWGVLGFGYGRSMGVTGRDREARLVSGLPAVVIGVALCSCVSRR